VPIVVVQHMPPMFTQLLAERLDRASRLTVVEAENGVPLQAGTVYIAPGTHHLEVARGPGGAPVTRLTEDPPENSCRPAVDVLFRSVGRVYAQAALGVVLTGMGHDGRLGAEAIRTAGGEVIAQDEASSVVWGMPGSVVNAGLAAKVLPLDQIGQWVVARVTEGRSAPKGVLTR
jgi:two-component system chemotaxis response regulator CheB